MCLVSGLFLACCLQFGCKASRESERQEFDVCSLVCFRDCLQFRCDAELREPNKSARFARLRYFRSQRAKLEQKNSSSKTRDARIVGFTKHFVFSSSKKQTRNKKLAIKTSAKFAARLETKLRRIGYLLRQVLSRCSCVCVFCACLARLEVRPTSLGCNIRRFVAAQICRNYSKRRLH